MRFRSSHPTASVTSAAVRPWSAVSSRASTSAPPARSAAAAAGRCRVKGSSIPLSSSAAVPERSRSRRILQHLHAAQQDRAAHETRIKLHDPPPAGSRRWSSPRKASRSASSPYPDTASSTNARNAAASARMSDWSNVVASIRRNHRLVPSSVARPRTPATPRAARCAGRSASSRPHFRRCRAAAPGSYRQEFPDG
jgi:hypothetical protein